MTNEYRNRLMAYLATSNCKDLRNDACAFFLNFHLLFLRTKHLIKSYRVNAISMANKDRDKIFNDIIDKMKSGEELTKQDIIALTCSPIMAGKLNKGYKILNAIRVVKDIDKEYRYDVESILYAFAIKAEDNFLK